MENLTKFKDAYGQEFSLTSEDFKLVQSDVSIHDAKLETKPTKQNLMMKNNTDMSSHSSEYQKI